MSLTHVLLRCRLSPESCVKFRSTDAPDWLFKAALRDCRLTLRLPFFVLSPAKGCNISNIQQKSGETIIRKYIGYA